MIIENFKKYYRDSKKGKSTLLDEMLDQVVNAADAGNEPMFIIADPEHNEAFKHEIKWSSSPNAEIRDEKESAWRVWAINNHILTV